MKMLAIILSISFAVVSCGEEKPAARKTTSQPEPAISDYIPETAIDAAAVPATVDATVDPLATTTPAVTGSPDLASLLANNPDLAKFIANNPSLAAYFANSPTPSNYSYSYQCIGNTCVVNENGVVKTIPLSELKKFN